MTWLRLLSLFVLAVVLAGDRLSTPVRAGETFLTSKLWIETSSTRHEFTVEIADTPARRAQGLMFREKMPIDHGMLFDFDKTGPVAMWMRNTLIPLDMLFINGDGTIHHIIVAAEPRTGTTRSSNGAVAAVLELNGHVSELLGIRPGDTIRHAMFGNAPESDTAN
ncbi:MAG: DUF192 domain-containing protein [Geminicoccaceae bacterium]